MERMEVPKGLLPKNGARLGHHGDVGSAKELVAS
jgi:hypothetical protein